MSAVEIMLERDTANDESAIVVAIHVPTGTPVENETLLFEIENSKAVQEVWSTSAGILTHDLTVGETVQFGVGVARILSAEAWAAEMLLAESAPKAAAVQAPPAVVAPVVVPNVAAAASPSPAASPVPQRRENANVFTPPAPQPPTSAPLPESRISQAAAALIAKHGLGPVRFDSDFVTTRVVHDFLKKTQLASASPAIQAEAPAPSPKKPAEPNQKQGRPVENRKRVEIDTLSKGAGETMLSVLGVTLGPLAIKRRPEDFLQDRITDLVMYEAARLMKKFPNLNSFYVDGQIVAHEQVHAGLAIDSGGRLVVYGVENADQVSLPDLSLQMVSGIERYMNNTLSSAEMSRATFTITDLSADELDFVFPLLPRGQSCILGITHSASSGYRIFAGFDHRVTEGREVAIFLGELRERLLSFAAHQAKTVEKAHCSSCGRSAEEAFYKGKELGLLKLVNREGHEQLCCASCWNGW
jgi:2-oxoglutarate dehydrogenase E2 component (dihydrolipoamide succinyltransferase)